ncbi:MAG: tetratricopeptide repeat protein, partial [Spirochaetaceae bacterium]|nr:tetratricopeptide repeat protein [Spirochaetaceae bacterium]
MIFPGNHTPKVFFLLLSGSYFVPVRFPGIIGVLFFLCFFSVFSCRTNPPVSETPLPSIPVNPGISAPSRGGSIAEEIRSLVESGTPSSLLQVLELIRSRELGHSEFGRMMIALSVTLLHKIYPDIQADFPLVDPPQTHIYTRILRDVEQGIYHPAPVNSTDYLEYVLPFLVVLRNSNGRSPPVEYPKNLLPDLLRAQELNPNSVLAPYFLGIFYEHSARPDEAAAEYRRVYAISPDCYPAVLGLARVMESAGQRQDAIRMLSDLVIRYPDNMTIKRQLALSYYNNRDWSRAEPAIAEILQRDPRDSQFILMRAHILVERGQFLQAQVPLDLYGTMDTGNRLYLYLRARVQAEGYRNRDAALNYLRSILRTWPGDEEAAVYAARLLMESDRSEDQSEGRELLQRLLNTENPSLLVVSLALQNAIRRQAWSEARPWLERLLRERRSPGDLVAAYAIEHGTGNNAAALQAARELYERDPANEEGVSVYISALIDTGRQDEASRMIENRLGLLPGGSLKGRYYYLRSRLRTNEELAMNDLRSSLFE